MAEPLVSVLTPTYNSEKFVEKTIKTALGQTYKNIEIVLVDDGSQDATPSILKRLADGDKRIKCYFQDNHGLAYSRNRLISLCKGDYIAFLDHDDEFLPDKIQAQIAAFKDKPEIAMVYGDVINRYSDGTERRAFKCRMPRRGRVFYEYLLEGNFMSLPSVLVKKDILARYLPYNQEYRIALDWDLFLKITREHDIDYVNKVVGIYNTHSDRFTARNPVMELDEVEMVLDFWAQEDPEILSVYKNKFLKAKAGIDFQRINHCQEKKKKVKLLLNCIGADPFCARLYAKLARVVLGNK